MNIKFLIFAITIFLTACSTVKPYVGLSIHPEGADEPEFYAPNPLGTVGARYEKDSYTVYCQHTSSIPYWEQGYGLNQCGIEREFNIK